MQVIREPLTKLTIHRRVIQNKQTTEREIYEGEVPMTQQEADSYKQLIGDGKASVTASAELSEMDYGNGGKVFVSVTLTVDQSQQGLETGVAWAKHLAQQKAFEHSADLKVQLQQRGIIR